MLLGAIARYLQGDGENRDVFYFWRFFGLIANESVNARHDDSFDLTSISKEPDRKGAV
jgi:hypothetical protein